LNLKEVLERVFIDNYNKTNLYENYKELMVKIRSGNKRER